MTRRPCKRATELACRRNALSEAERLDLEQHLGQCEDCAREEAELRALIAGAGVAEMPTLSPRARERAIAGALLRAGAENQGNSRGVRFGARRLWVPSVAFAAAAAVALGYLAMGPESNTRVSSTVVPADDDVQRPSDRVLSGRLASTAGALERDSAIAPNTVLTADGEAEVALAHARVVLADESQVAWDPTTSTVSLSAGELRAAVDPTQHRGFRVMTADFVVEVVGTEFAVTQRKVIVDHGVVRIEARDGVPLVERLEAGQTWSLDDAVAVAPAPPAHDAGAPEPTASADVPTAELLSLARSQLAARNADGARRTIRFALRSKPSAAERAEAQTLLAECHLVDGDTSAAVQQYLRVAKRYRRLAAGETALFAAARLEANAGHESRARTLLQRYLSRYPTGRFRAEAEQRLGEL